MSRGASMTKTQIKTQIKKLKELQEEFHERTWKMFDNGEIDITEVYDTIIEINTIYSIGVDICRGYRT
jgi:hypothetical protein